MLLSKSVLGALSTPPSNLFHSSSSSVLSHGHFLPFRLYFCLLLGVYFSKKIHRNSTEWILIIVLVQLLLSQTQTDREGEIQVSGKLDIEATEFIFFERLSA